MNDVSEVNEKLLTELKALVQTGAEDEVKVFADEAMLRLRRNAISTMKTLFKVLAFGYMLNGADEAKAKHLAAESLKTSLLDFTDRQEGKEATDE